MAASLCTTQRRHRLQLLDGGNFELTDYFETKYGSKDHQLVVQLTAMRNPPALSASRCGSLNQQVVQ